MKRYGSLIAAAGALTALPAAASAQDQPWLQDRRYTEGIGIRTGDFEIHPGVAIELGYDSNYFRRAGQEDPIGSMRLRVTPSFSFSTLSPQRRGATPGAPPPDLEFRGGIAATYNEFFPVSGGDDGQYLMKEQRNVSGLLDLTLNILPGRPWSGSLYGDFGRAITPSNQGITSDSFNRINARAGAEIAWAPGGGLFDWRLGYNFEGVVFESARFTELTNLENTIQTRGRWRFLPRTALMYDARFGFVTYPSGTEKTSSHPVRARIGMNGLITSSFGLLALVGWGSSFYSAPAEDHNFDSVIGQLEVKWYITPTPSSDPAAATMATSAVTLGFLRDFQDSYIGSYFERDRGYVNLSYFFGGRFLLVVDGGIGPVIYPAIEELDKPNGFTDLRVDASIFGEYRFKDRFGLNTTIRYGGNLSDNFIVVPPEVPDYLNYNQFEIYLGARWFL